MIPTKDYLTKIIETQPMLSINTAAQFAKDKKCAIVTGVTGQDGSHMVDYLLANTDIEVFGGVRRLSVNNHSNIKHINNERFHLINFDLTDSHTISRVIEVIKPAYFINLAAQSFVGSSWDFAQQTWETNTTAVLNILEAIRLYYPSCRFYQAGSSEEFGDVIYSPQDEKHPLRPRSPYGASKAAARQLVKVWRESYDIYAVQGWLFNHEGVRRGDEFVTRKITKKVAQISEMIMYNRPFSPLELGNLDSIRDWSDAEDFIDGIWKMLHQEGDPKEYVLSSGETHTVREFVELAFKWAGIIGKWVKGDKPEDEKFISENDDVLVEVNPNFYRPAEVNVLQGDSTKARTELGWQPKTTFNELVRKMVWNDLGTANAIIEP
jgi:GDPmannose 4,6-dehydratase